MVHKLNRAGTFSKPSQPTNLPNSFSNMKSIETDQCTFRMKDISIYPSFFSYLREPKWGRVKKGWSASERLENCNWTQIELRSGSKYVRTDFQMSMHVSGIRFFFYCCVFSTLFLLLSLISVTFPMNVVPTYFWTVDLPKQFWARQLWHWSWLNEKSWLFVAGPLFDRSFEMPKWNSHQNLWSRDQTRDLTTNFDSNPNQSKPSLTHAAQRVLALDAIIIIMIWNPHLGWSSSTFLHRHTPRPWVATEITSVEWTWAMGGDRANWQSLHWSCPFAFYWLLWWIWWKSDLRSRWRTHPHFVEKAHSGHGGTVQMI